MKKLGITLSVFFFILVGVYFLLSSSKSEFMYTDLYDEILSRGFIRVGINVDSKPFGYVNSGGEIVGYNVDLAKNIAQYLVKNSNKLEIIPVTPSNRLIKASTGEVDFVISTVTITPQRLEVVDFSVPYDTAGQAILVRSDSVISSMSDLAGQSVGVIFGTTAEQNIKKHVPNVNLRGFTSYQDAYEALKMKKINAITSDDTILNRFAIDDNNVKLLPKRYSNEPYGIAFRKGESSKKLKEHLDFAIKDMQEKNVIARLRKSWGIGF